MSENLEMKVTSIEELKKAMQGELVELPSFTSDIPFVARLKRPSMLGMIKSGKIRNELLIEANKLFASGSSHAVTDKLDENVLKEMGQVMDIICSESFIEPSWNELQTNNIQLTDEQMMAVFTYSQNGVEALKSFR